MTRIVHDLNEVYEGAQTTFIRVAWTVPHKGCMHKRKEYRKELIMECAQVSE